MWPFSKKKPEGVIRNKRAGEALQVSQLDITEGFGDNARLKPGEWIETTPMTKRIPNPQELGLPGLDASADEVYALASKLSRFREALPLPSDGVYCPICHAATVGLELLRKPCPKCGRELLKFGWD